jgi:hypothetical protein
MERFNFGQLFVFVPNSSTFYVLLIFFSLQKFKENQAFFFVRNYEKLNSQTTRFLEDKKKPKMSLSKLGKLLRREVKNYPNKSMLD